MNRRTFLAALASIPLVGRLVPKANGLSPEFIQAIKQAPTIIEVPPVITRVDVHEYLKKHYSPEFIQVQIGGVGKRYLKVFDE